MLVGRSNHPLVLRLGLLQAQDRAALSAHQLWKSKKYTHKPKSEDAIQEKLYLTNNGTKFVNQTLQAYYDDVGISHQTSVAGTPQQNVIIKRQNQTLVEAARTIEDLGKLKPKADIRIFIGYAPVKKAFRLIIKTIHVEFDELTALVSEQFGSGPELQLMTHGTISS
ncbi:retrovirus-related pol polyprotein from transposon TNT 1-94 [Tanacetum coccineum]